MRTISESLSCNLPRCKGTPERTTCGKKPTRRKGVTTVTEPAFAGKKRMRVRSIARAIVSSVRPITPYPPNPLPPHRFSCLFFPFPFFFRSPVFFFPSLPPFPPLFFSLSLFCPANARAFPARPRMTGRRGDHPPPPPPSSVSVRRWRWTGHRGDPARVLLAMFRTRHYRNNRRRHTLIKRTHHTRDPSSHAT